MSQPSFDRFRISWFLTACLCMCVITTAQAKELTCYSTEFPPYVTSKNNAISGIDVDILADAARRAGIVIQFKLLPWVRLENELKRGAASEVDCAFSFSKNVSRQSYMDFTSTPIKSTHYVLFAKKGVFTASAGLAQMKGKRIGLRRGFIVSSAFEDMRTARELVVEEIDSDEANFIKLEKGRIDGVIASADSGYTMVSPSQRAAIVSIELGIPQTPTYVVFNKEKNLAGEKKSLNKALRDTIADGSAKKIRDKYLQMPLEAH